MKRFFRYFLPYVKDYKLYLFYSIVGTILVAGASAASAYLVKPVLDDIFIKKDTTMLQILPFFGCVGVFCQRCWSVDSKLLYEFRRAKHRASAKRDSFRKNFDF